MSEKEKEDFRLWDSERVGVWLVENGFDDYKDNFLEHKITGDLLLDLNYHALLEIGVIIVGDRARILQAIKRQFNKEKTTTPKGLYQRPSVPKQFSGENDSDSKKENRASFDLKKYENRNSFDMKKYEGLKSVETIPDNVSNSPKQVRKINSPISIPKPIRDSPILKEPGPIIINRSRENSGTRELYIPTKLDIDSHQQAFRNQRTGVSQLKILPRSSSMKDSKEKKSNHQDLNEAMQSVFGISTTPSNHSTPTYANSTAFSTVNSAASTILGFNIPTPTQSLLGSESSSTSISLPLPPEKTIMDFQRVREKCIKVHGLEDQHVIKVADLKDASSIRKRIYLKCGVVENSENKWDLFVLIDDNLILLDDKELVKICTTDNELRSNIHLRQTAKKLESEPEVEPKSIQKLQKFFGESPSSGDPLKKMSKKETKASVKGPARSTSLFNQNNPNRPTASSKNKNLIAFFGERPPDEMIVDQLEKFFPGINLAKEEGKNSHNSVDIKNMVQANLINKRTSKRESSFMLRRMSRQSDIKLSQRPQAIVVKPSDLSKSITMAELQKIQEEDKNTLDSLGSDVNTIGSQNTNTIGSQNDAESPKMEKRQKKIDWTLGELIGQGAFGKVFMAINLANYEFMAVKQVLLGMDNPQEKKSADSLKHEIELLSELNHDNIVRYIGFESKQDSVNVFLEYVSGGSIASCLTKYGKFPVDITKSFTAQILCGLEYLHSKDIIHRDIKGANEYSAYHRMTRLSMQGSIYWMAPEAARGKGYSAKVDIWSCGCLVLEMLTGHVPWHQVRGNIIYLLGTGNAPPIPANLTDESKNFLRDTFQIDPEKRPTASQLLDHPFTDIDIASVDFAAWTKIAAQQRLEEGSTSEEDAKKTDSEFEDDSDFDEEDEEFDDEEIMEEESNQPTPKSASAATLPVDISPPTPNPEEKEPIEDQTETALLAPEPLLRVSETSVDQPSSKSSVTDNFSKHTSLQYDDSYDEDFYNVEYSAQEVESLQYLLQTQPDE
ncbi:hypothetical protein HK103_005672 [Boothiomyces macroporosus]|uniref:Uncharacterized protein n=1 Tax=Boothiomyces macroporosus TaxID=261099 RepID=A0AAD5Y7A1_9FUNG|nr:hypothetical protein HK103_005672 [Boothiomyces macroporosus]